MQAKARAAWKLSVVLQKSSTNDSQGFAGLHAAKTWRDRGCAIVLLLLCHKSQGAYLVHSSF